MGRYSSKYRVSHEHMAMELAEIKNLLIILVRLLLEDGQSKLVTAIQKSSRFRPSPQGEATPPASPPAIPGQFPEPGNAEASFQWLTPPSTQQWDGKKGEHNG